MLLFSIACTVVVVVGLQFLLASCKKVGWASRLELERKVQHASTGLLLVAVQWTFGFTSRVATAILLGCAAAYYCVHLARLRSARLNKLLVRMFAGMLREDEKIDRVPAAFWFLLGPRVLLLLLLLPPPPPSPPSLLLLILLILRR